MKDDNPTMNMMKIDNTKLVEQLKYDRFVVVVVSVFGKLKLDPAIINIQPSLSKHVEVVIV